MPFYGDDDWKKTQQMLMSEAAKQMEAAKQVAEELQREVYRKTTNNYNQLGGQAPLLPVLNQIDPLDTPFYRHAMQQAAQQAAQSSQQAVPGEDDVDETVVLDRLRRWLEKDLAYAEQDIIDALWRDAFNLGQQRLRGRLFPLPGQPRWDEGGYHPTSRPPYCHDLGDEDMADQRQQNPVIITPTGILSFPNLFEKRAVVAGGEERYSVNLIFDEAAQKTDAYKALQKAIMDAAKKFFGDKIPKNMAWPLRDADEKEGKYEGYTAGRKFVGAWTKTAPGIIGPDKADVLGKDSVWAGQKARLAVKPFAYDKGGNKGVGLVLDCVQIVKFDMPRIDGKTPSKSAFPDDLETSNDSDDDEIPF